MTTTVTETVAQLTEGQRDALLAFRPGKWSTAADAEVAPAVASKLARLGLLHVQTANRVGKVGVGPLEYRLSRHGIAVGGRLYTYRRQARTS